MPRKSTGKTAGTTDTSGAAELDGRRKSAVRLSDLSGEGAFAKIKSFVTNPRTHQALGVLLIVLALFAAVSYVSFFFTGSSDQSVLSLSRAERVASRAQIHNLLGLPGALLASFLIDDLFGLTSLLLVVMLLMGGMRLLSVQIPGSPLRRVSIGAFWLLWGATLLGFVQQVFGVETYFRLGGHFGQRMAGTMLSYIYVLGTLMVLLGVLVIFLIISNRNFVPFVQRVWQRLTTRQPKQPTTDPVLNPVDRSDEVTTDPSEQDDNPDSPITITLTPLDETTVSTGETGNLIINSPTPEKQDDEDSDTDNDPEAEDNPDQPLEIESHTVEIVEEQLPDYDPRLDLEFYKFPTLDLLKVYDNENAPVIDQSEQQENANRIVTTLRNYGIEIEQIRATVGPTVTLYEVVPQAGVRIAKIQSLENDIMLSLSAIGIRIIAPMPGKGTVGIEVPNEKPQVVSMHSVIASRRFQEEQKMRLPVALGRTITNEVFCFDLAKTPHLLVAGATGQGKSVGLNAIITSLLYKKHPSELKFVLVDPKMVEFSVYKQLIRHYMAAMPDQEDRDIIITDSQKVINSLNSLVIEMEDRYSLLADSGVRNMEDYNDKFIHRRLNPLKDVENLVTHKVLHHHYMPYIVIIIDEYGDFIMVSGKEVERPIQRLTQKARAVGMHMILATQRPDVKVVTGIIKANVPTRIAFRTQSVVDSRTVLDTKGAEHLIGKGDLLYSGGGNITRIQCAFVDTPEVEAIVSHISEQQGYQEPYQLPEYVPEGGGDDEPSRAGEVDMKRLDPMFAEVARFVVNKQEGSTSRLQRAFEIGYNRAGKLSDQLEKAGIVGPNKGPKGRDVLIQDLESLELLLQRLGVA